MDFFKVIGYGLLALFYSQFVIASEADSTAVNKTSLDTQVEDLKQQVIRLNRDFFILEEEILFPVNTQVKVYVSMDVGYFFALDSVKLVLDGTEVANYLYTEKQVKALLKGGVQELHVGNLKSGDHELVAFFMGKGPKGRDYKRGTELKFNKDAKPKFIELRISDSTLKQQPEFVAKQW